MDQFKRFFKVSKVDEEERMVYGYASTPDLDTQGEIVALNALENALPAYMKFPALREMHQPSAVGTTKEANVDNKGLYIGAKVVDDNAWKKVKEGVYPAFSIGGNVLKRNGKVLEEIELVEISLVDSPANKSAVIELWKSESVQKSSTTAYYLANAMIHIKDCVKYMKGKGYEAKKLEKALELLKEAVSEESLKPEDEDDDAGFFYARQAAIVKIIKSLEGFKFEENSPANKLRLAVIENMNKMKKQEEPVTPDAPTEPKAPETEPAAPVKPATPPAQEPAAPAEPAPAAPEKKEGDEPVEPAEPAPAPETPAEPAPTAPAQPEKSNADLALEKAIELEKNLAKFTGKKEEEINKSSQTLEKAVTSLLDSLSKVSDVLGQIDERLKKVESTPAALKSKATFVAKDGNPVAPEGGEDKATELQTKKARLKELDTLYNKVGANEFAKLGYSKEAVQLKDEVKRLEAEQG